MHSHLKVKFHYCICKNMPRSQILNQNNPYYPFPFYFFKTHFSTTFLSACRSSKLSLFFRFLHHTQNNQTQECFLIIAKTVEEVLSDRAFCCFCINVILLSSIEPIKHNVSRIISFINFNAQFFIH